MAYPIYDLFRTCGAVEARREGLYLRFCGQTELRQGFWHLYHCRGEQVTRLGLFCPEGESMVCHGRISLRSLGEWEGGCFTLRALPCAPLTEPLDGGYLPPRAVLLQKDGRRFVLIERKDSLPQEIMPYFCFLAPGMLADIPCLGFEIDGEGRPLMPE